MKRSELEHAIRAACDVAGDNELIVIGSQAVLGQFPDATGELTRSREVDVFPKNRPDAWAEIDAVLGELSIFHSTHGFYVHGVDPSTARLPAGWRERLLPVEGAGAGKAIGWCLEVHDLAASKLAVPERERDFRFVKTLVDEGRIDLRVLRARVADMELSASERAYVEGRIARIESAWSAGDKSP